MKTFLIVVGALLAIMLLGAIIALNAETKIGVVRETNTFRVDDEGRVLVSNKSLLINPSITSVATTTSGTLALDKYYFVLTSLDDDGNETSRSSVVSQTISTTTAAGLNVTFTVNPLAASHRLWFSLNGNDFDNYRTATSTTWVASTTTGWTAGTLPTINSAFNDIEVDNAYSYHATTTAGTAVLKTSKGIIHAVTINTDAAGTVILYDNTSCTGTKIATLEASAPVGTYTYNAIFNTGLCVTTAATTDLTIMYK
jgi:hypothetical protein